MKEQSFGVRLAVHPGARRRGCLAFDPPSDDSLSRRGRVHDAYNGSLGLHYSKEENLLRATWKR